MAQDQERRARRRSSDTEPPICPIFTLLATEPKLLDRSVDCYREHLARGLSKEDADPLRSLAKRHKRQLPISADQLVEDLRENGIKPSEQNLATLGRVAAAAYRNANIEACNNLRSPLEDGEVWPLPNHLARLAQSANPASKPGALIDGAISGPLTPAAIIDKRESRAPDAPLLSERAKRSLAPTGLRLAGLGADQLQPPRLNYRRLGATAG